jgi:hypothetical protein
MMYETTVVVCAEIITKLSTQSEHDVEFLNFKPGGSYRNRLALNG